MTEHDIDPRASFEEYWQMYKSKLSFNTDTEELMQKTFCLSIWNAAIRHSDACDTRYFDGLADGQTSEREKAGKEIAANRYQIILPDGGKGFIDRRTAERAYEVYSFLYGTEQSLERLEQRGGFYLEELNDFLNGESLKKAKARGFRFKKM